ncbi:MAG: rhomboid family intramembrane serine protease [Bacteroidales bacterium]|nr:rhomboid family intramembrane serine protease [Bacteroidales bacterium]
MLFSEKLSASRRQFIHAVFIPVVISILIILVFLLEKGMNWDFHKAGIMPRDFKYLTGILTYIFIHADWGHLTNNILSFLVLGSCLFYFYNLIATKVLFFSYILSGILLWLIGRENWHIGASGLIYSIAFFLFFSGLIRKHIPLIAISLIITFLYGSMIWHVFPWKVNDPISWEGHLSGGISGLVLSVIFRKSGPQRPEIDWGEEEDDFEEADSEFIENEEATEENLKVD